MLETGAEEDVLEDEEIANFSQVTIQYEVHSYHGVQSRPIAGFHLWNSAGVTKMQSRKLALALPRADNQLSLTTIIFADVFASLISSNVMPFGTV